MSYVVIRGWYSRYKEIQKILNISEKRDVEAAILLNSIIKNPVSSKKIERIVRTKSVFVIGSGPSLKNSFRVIKDYQEVPKIVADSSIKSVLDNGITPDIVVTDLDGDLDSLTRIGRNNTVMVVHAHGDNISKLFLAEKFRNCIGTTQTRPYKKINNFGGFTDGDRCVFLANYFGAKNIILFGMDFGERIGTYSHTKDQDTEIKLKKLRIGRNLLEWLAKKRKHGLYTTSQPISGFKKIPFSKLHNITIT